MNKKLVLGGLGIILAVVVFYNLSGPTETTEVGEDGEPVETSFASKIKNSVQNIIPGGEDKNLGRLEESPHVVVIKNNPVKMDVEDAADRIEALKDSKEEEGVDFARWTLFSENSQYTVAEKQQLLERIKEVMRPDDVKMILKDIILVGQVPELYDDAMTSLGQGMSKEQLEGFVREVLASEPNPEAKAAVIEYAATRNIYVK